MPEDFARLAQERYDRWVCLNGTLKQKSNVGTKNGSTVRCGEVLAGVQSGGDYPTFPRQTEVPGPPLDLPSRANQKANIFTKAFDPQFRKVIVLLIAGFLLFLAVTSYQK